MGAKLKVAVLGSGNIGTDLVYKIQRSPWLECSLFIGRSAGSEGLRKAAELGVPTSDRSIQAIIDDPGCCDLVFDATSAKDHIFHSSVLAELGKQVIDLTPSKIGATAVPAVALDASLNHPNVNMVSCGGQASIPLAHVVGQQHDEVEYIEVVSSIASKSAGPATRRNLDEYIQTTEEAVIQYSGCKRAKVILILNPAEPCIEMQTTVSAKVKHTDIEKLREAVHAMVAKVQTYVPGYQLVIPPVFENNRIVMMARVRGRGDYLPPYAGNLDIINCAAIATAEAYARRKLGVA